MKTQPSVLIRCDHPGCRSTCELTHPHDLDNLHKALRMRGWSRIDVKANNVTQAELDFCPTHAQSARDPKLLKQLATARQDATPDDTTHTEGSD